MLVKLTTGYVLMNWTAEFARHSKAKKALKKKKVEISPTFYEQLLRQLSFVKKLQT